MGYLTEVTNTYNSAKSKSQVEFQPIVVPSGFFSRLSHQLLSSVGGTKTNLEPVASRITTASVQDEDGASDGENPFAFAATNLIELSLEDVKNEPELGQYQNQ